MATATPQAPRTFVINKKSGGNFTPMVEGLHPAVVAEVKDLGVISGAYGAQHKFVFRFVNEAGEEASRFYTPSIHEKSTLHKDWNSLVEIGEEFDIYSLEGQQCNVLVTNGEKDGKTTAKVEKVLKPSKGQKVTAPAKGATAPATATVTKKTATKASNATTKTAAKKTTAADAGEITDDDIPF